MRRTEEWTPDTGQPNWTLAVPHQSDSSSAASVRAKRDRRIYRGGGWVLSANDIFKVTNDIATGSTLLTPTQRKGMIQGNSDEYYRKGITYSIERWGIDETTTNDYLAQAQIALPADTPGKLAKIADQKWLALFLVTAETYLDLRRTQLPNIFDNGNLSTYEFPLRYRYPGNELGLNKDAYEAGVGGLQPAVDDEMSKMWLLQ